MTMTMKSVSWIERASMHATRPIEDTFEEFFRTGGLGC